MRGEARREEAKQNIEKGIPLPDETNKRVIEALKRLKNHFRRNLIITLEKVNISDENWEAWEFNSWERKVLRVAFSDVYKLNIVGSAFFTKDFDPDGWTYYRLGSKHNRIHNEEAEKARQEVRKIIIKQINDLVAPLRNENTVVFATLDTFAKDVLAATKLKLHDAPVLFKINSRAYHHMNELFSRKHGYELMNANRIDLHDIAKVTAKIVEQLAI